ncbi:unnamed protein product [Brassica oleracea]|uniref:Uncharacterized protein n=1 Tax=Brassica oleracea var. oleracea TaxID=109376 RepID=A0A0D3BN71_BRAOL
MAPFLQVQVLRALHNSSIMIVRQLFIGPKRHQPFDPDAPLHRVISAASSMPPCLSATAKGLTFLALAAAFAQQLFLLHLHSGDNMNLEGQYHLLFQFVIFASLITTLMGIAMPPKNKLMLFTVRKSTTHLQYNHQRTN